MQQRTALLRQKPAGARPSIGDLVREVNSSGFLGTDLGRIWKDDHDGSPWKVVPVTGPRAGTGACSDTHYSSNELILAEDQSLQGLAAPGAPRTNIIRGDLVMLRDPNNTSGSLGPQDIGCVYDVDGSTVRVTPITGSNATENHGSSHSYNANDLKFASTNLPSVLGEDKDGNIGFVTKTPSSTDDKVSVSPFHSMESENYPQGSILYADGSSRGPCPIFSEVLNIPNCHKCGGVMCESSGSTSDCDSCGQRVGPLSWKCRRVSNCVEDYCFQCCPPKIPRSRLNSSVPLVGEMVRLSPRYQPLRRRTLVSAIPPMRVSVSSALRTIPQGHVACGS
jgi:hypothetical protein